jgi:cellulose synthase (UDP-forming)
MFRGRLASIMSFVGVSLLQFSISKESIMLSLCFLVGLFFCLIAAVPVDYMAQFILGWTIYVFVYFGYRINPPKGYSRIIFLILASFLVLRYFFWRTLFTLSFDDPLSCLVSFLLYLAELYAIIIFFLGIFVSIYPIKRKPVAISFDDPRLPTVDILIPTYNESIELLEQTLACALNIKYPKSKLNVYLLDDGGTDARCNHINPNIANTARKRREQLSQLTIEYGAHYIARKQNDHAKAGNINYALSHINGDLILILDADHAPTVDILEKTVGLFMQDEKLFLVQTPHFFINPDPIEKNLHIFGKIPSENEMFYFNIQHGLDFWNSSFFCGSAAILRRKYLLEVGGIAGCTITEDAETALGLHARGYNSAYIGHPMISGLQPQTFSDFINQRIRWAQGMTQILIMKNPLLQSNLKFYQKFCYINSSFFWLFAFARLVFLLAPICYLIFGLYIYKAYILEIFAYTLPYIFTVVLISNYLYGKTRRPFISELYELMQSFFLLPAIWQVFRAPNAPVFKVTPKTADLKQDFISELSTPFYIIYILLFCALIAAIYRYIAYPKEIYTITVTAVWTIINILLMNGAIGALYERRQLRANPRIPVNLPALLKVSNTNIIIPCRISDLSISGCMLKMYFEDYRQINNITHATLTIYNHFLDQHNDFEIEIRYTTFPFKDTVALGSCFLFKNRKEFINIALLNFGDSNRWYNIVKNREYPQSILNSFAFIVLIGAKEMWTHSKKIFALVCDYIVQFLLKIYYSVLIYFRWRIQGCK